MKSTSIWIIYLFLFSIDSDKYICLNLLISWICHSCLLIMCSVILYSHSVSVCHWFWLDLSCLRINYSLFCILVTRKVIITLYWYIFPLPNCKFEATSNISVDQTFLVNIVTCWYLVMYLMFSNKIVGLEKQKWMLLKP